VTSAVWANVVMDFIEGFPHINSKVVILTVVDYFSKYSHFILLGHLYMTMTVARAFFNNIVCLYGMSSSIVSDIDPVLKRVVHHGGSQAQPLIGFSPRFGWTIRGCKQDHNHASAVSLRRLASLVASMVALGGILL
jgi:hypothetical protein